MSDEQTTKESITPREAFWVNVMRLNRATKTLEIRRKWAVGRLEVTFSWRSKKNPMGRFGGGWNWQLGFEAGGSTIIVTLLVCSVRFHWKKAPTPPATE